MTGKCNSAQESIAELLAPERSNGRRCKVFSQFARAFSLNPAGRRSRLQNVANMAAVSKQMESVNRVISGAIKTMDFEKSVVNMEQFEKQCQDLGSSAHSLR